MFDGLELQRLEFVVLIEHGLESTVGNRLFQKSVMHLLNRVISLPGHHYQSRI